MVYFGPIGDNCDLLRDYFRNILPEENQPPDSGNIASWMLNITGAGINHEDEEEGERIEFNEKYLDSTIYHEEMDEIEVLRQENGEINEVNKLNFFRQLYYLLIRTARDYWRKEDFNISRLVTIFTVSMITGIVFFNVYIYILNILYLFIKNRFKQQIKLVFNQN